MAIQNLNPEAEKLATGLRALRALRTKGEEGPWRDWLTTHGKVAGVQLLVNLPYSTTRDAQQILLEMFG